MNRFARPAATLIETLWAAAAANPGAAVAFQGAPGAYSHQAVREMAPEAPALPCFSFEEALEAVIEGRAGAAAIPVENSLHGRVADVHFLLPESGLFVIAEHEVKVEHCLLGAPGATLAQVRRVRSHPQALGQCRRRLKAMNLMPETAADTAGAAAEVAELRDASVAALASRLAGELYGCALLADSMQDADHNRTRFLLLARSPLDIVPPDPKTTLAFEVKNVPAALFKALGGFATNGVNLTRLESHLRGGGFTAAEFLIDIEGAPQDPAVARALEELAFHSKWVRLLGSYPRASAVP
jgi:prephenate dehydratase